MAGKKAPTLGSVVDSMVALREERRAIAARDKELEEQYKEAQQQLIEMLDAQGLEKCTGNSATASISETEVFNFDGDDGFEKFMTHIARVKRWDLVQRRPSNASCREYYAQKGAIPGLVPFTERKINLRNL